MPKLDYRTVAYLYTPNNTIQLYSYQSYQKFGLVAKANFSLGLSKPQCLKCIRAVITYNKRCFVFSYFYRKCSYNETIQGNWVPTISIGNTGTLTCISVGS